MKKKKAGELPQLPPGYCWARDGDDFDIIKGETVPKNYPEDGGTGTYRLVAWVHGTTAIERSILKDTHTWKQRVDNMEEALHLLATRLWLGMNEP